MLSIRWAGQQFDLFPERGLLWRRAKTLLIADPHFGKAAAFRDHGVPVPRGTTQADVDRLSSLLNRSRAERLIILGDLLHARNGRADSTMSILQTWRNRHQSLNVMLVRGNHDQLAGDPPAEWAFTCVDDPCIDGDFRFCHDPSVAKRSSKAFVFAGHVHPCAILHDVDGSAVRAACFAFSKRVALLPAFGTFTGMRPVRLRNGDRVFAVGPDEVSEVRTLQPARR